MEEGEACLFLREMLKLIPWKEIEILLIERGIYKPNKGKQGVKERMKERGMILSKGTLVDATLIHAPEPKIKKDGNGNVIS